MTLVEDILNSIRKHYPSIQAVYLFGSFGTELETEQSDLDIALLFDAEKAKSLGLLGMSNLRFELEELTGRTVDLLNLRLVNTVLQKEVIFSNRRALETNKFAADEFEMLTISKYQKLNDERKEIVEDAIKKGSFHHI